MISALVLREILDHLGVIKLLFLNFNKLNVWFADFSRHHWAGSIVDEKEIERVWVGKGACELSGLWT